MCFNRQAIKSVSPYGSRIAYVPCGHCETCRGTERHAWSWRLQAELTERQRQGWSVGFCTLTYGNEAQGYLGVPKIPYTFFDDPDSAPDVDCFSRGHCEEFVLALRKWLHRHYGVKQLVYCISSEFGERRHRPHYHMIVSWPKAKCRDKVDLGNAPVLDAETMYKFIESYWTQRHGFVFPRYLTGGFDGRYYHKPFEISNAVSFAAKYAAKYMCKDIAYNRYLSHYTLSEEDYLQPYIRRCMPFHIQSRSLGLSFIKNMSDETKFELLQNGVCFAGSTSFDTVPLYIRNKIYFDPWYIVNPDDGRRLVRRQRSEFFLNYREEIYQKKVDFYTDLVTRAQTDSFWFCRGLNSDMSFAVARKFTTDLEKFGSYGMSAADLAADYVAYYGVSPQNCYDVSRSLQWFSRYTDIFVNEDTGELTEFPVSNELDFSRCDTISRDYWCRLHEFWTFFFDALHECGNAKYHMDEELVKDDYRINFYQLYDELKQVS